MKKGIISSVIALIILGFLMPIVYSAENFNVSTKVDKNTVEIGDEVILTMTTSQETDAATFLVTYDDKSFEFKESQTTNLQAEIKNGKIACAYVDTTGSGTKEMKLKFASKKVVSNAKFEVSNAKFGVAGSETVNDNLDNKISSSTVTVYQSTTQNSNNSTNNNSINTNNSSNSSDNSSKNNSSNNNSSSNSSNSDNNAKNISNTAKITTSTTSAKASTEDKTTSNTILPKTGLGKAIFSVILVVLVVGLILSIRYKKLNDIFKSGGLMLAVSVVIASMSTSKSYAKVEDKIEFFNKLSNIEKVATITVADYKNVKCLLVSEVKKANNKVTDVLRNQKVLAETEEIKTGDIIKANNVEYEVVLYGDADCNGVICEMYDINVIIDSYLGRQEATGLKRIAANLYNSDNDLDAADIKVMIDIMLNKKTNDLLKEEVKEVKTESNLEVKFTLDGKDYKDEKAKVGLKINGEDQGYVTDYSNSLQVGTTYEFYGINLNDEVIENNNKGTIGDENAVVIIDLNTVSISVNDTNFGTVSSSEMLVLNGTTYTTSDSILEFNDGRKVIAEPKEQAGYTTTLKDWSLTSGTITEATDFVANFERTENIYTISLNSQEATTAGTTKIYQKYDIGVYKEESCTNAITMTENEIDIPTKSYVLTYKYNDGLTADKTETLDATFNGYYTETEGSGEQRLTASGYLLGDWNNYYTSNSEIYASWTNKTATLETPTRSGFTFKGWYKESDFKTQLSETITPTEDMIIYAKWEDTDAPTVTIDNIGLSSLTFSATDNVGIVGYIVSTSEIQPSATDSEWQNITSTISLANQTVANLNPGTYYVYVKDDVGNIGISTNVTIQLSGSISFGRPIWNSSYTAASVEIMGSSMSYGASLQYMISGDSEWTVIKSGDSTVEVENGKTIYARIMYLTSEIPIPYATTTIVNNNPYVTVTSKTAGNITFTATDDVQLLGYLVKDYYGTTETGNWNSAVEEAIQTKNVNKTDENSYAVFNGISGTSATFSIYKGAYNYECVELIVVDTAWNEYRIQTSYEDTTSL